MALFANEARFFSDLGCSHHLTVVKVSEKKKSMLEHLGANVLNVNDGSLNGVSIAKATTSS